MSATRKDLIQQLTSNLPPRLAEMRRYDQTGYDMNGYRWLFRCERGFYSGDVHGIRTCPVSYPVLTSIYIPEEFLDDEETIEVDLMVDPYGSGNLLCTRLCPNAIPCPDIITVQKAISTAVPYIQMRVFDPGFMLSAATSLFVGTPVRYGECFYEVVFVEEKWTSQSFSVGSWCGEIDKNKLKASPTDPTLDTSTLKRIDQHLYLGRLYCQDPLKYTSNDALSNALSSLRWRESNIVPDNEHLLFA